MPYYRVAGEIPRKRHVRFRSPAGGLYAEELMGEEGFVSDSSLLYHEHPPTAIVKSEAVVDAAAEARLLPNHPLLPRHFRTQDLPQGGDLVLGRQLMMANDDVRISFAEADGVQALVVEARGHIRPPRRYLSQFGQFLEHAPYCERDLRGPEGPLLDDGEDVPVIVRNRAGLTR